MAPALDMRFKRWYFADKAGVVYTAPAPEKFALFFTKFGVYTEFGIEPILIGNFFQQFYSIADALIVGRFVGKEAFAAIDATATLLRLPVGFFIGVANGATILVSQAYGARDAKWVSGLVHTAVASSLLFGLIFSALCYVTAPWLLGLMAVPADIFDTALIYDEILFAGMVLPLIFNIGCGILRAVGDSRRPFCYLVFACLTNIALDLLFVIGLGWGAAGAAVATVVAQGLSALLVIVALCRYQDVCRLTLRAMRINRRYLLSILRTGLPIGLQGSTYYLANVLIHARINMFGTGVIAAVAVFNKLDLLVWILVEAMTISVSTFVGQNYGAHQLSRVRRSVDLCISTGLLITAALSVALYFSGEALSLCLVDDAETARLAGEIMRFMAPWYFTAVWAEILPGAIRATGETLAPTLLTMISPFTLRILWILLVAPFFPSIYWVLVVFPLSWGVTAALFVVYYHRYKRRRLMADLLSLQGQEGGA